jgi:hypothetical protein
VDPYGLLLVIPLFGGVPREKEDSDGKKGSAEPFRCSGAGWAASQRTVALFRRTSLMLKLCSLCVGGSCFSRKGPPKV